MIEDRIKAPFSYPGSKEKLLEHILDILPKGDKYIEPFGGSGVVLLNRDPSNLEVFNDKYTCITDFYKCLQSDLIDKLIEKCKLTVHSRELFYQYKNSLKYDIHRTDKKSYEVGAKNRFETNRTDDQIVENAYRWYYLMRYSFGGKGMQFARMTKGKNNISGKIDLHLKEFWYIHARLRKVIIENLDWEQCIEDYSPGIFYLDPPYLDVENAYQNTELSTINHRKLLDIIHSTKGYFAISGFENELYNQYKWDEEYSFERFQRWGKREYVTEKIWVKNNGME